MKLVRLLGLAVVLAGVFFTAFAADSAAVGNVLDIRHVKVTKGLATVYLSYTNPKPEQIIGLVKKGTRVELLRESVGGSWYEVRVEGKIGYLKAREGKVVYGDGGSTVMIVIFVVLFICLLLGVVLYVMKQRNSPAVSSVGDDDIDDDLDDLDDDD